MVSGRSGRLSEACGAGADQLAAAHESVQPAGRAFGAAVAPAEGVVVGTADSGAAVALAAQMQTVRASPLTEPQRH